MFFKLLARCFLPAAVVLLSACQSVELPKGTARGYQTARLVRPGNNASVPGIAPQANPANDMIQSALASEFGARGFRLDPANADLTVAYLVIVQDNVSTKVVDDYFGFGRSSMQLADAAHSAGVVNNRRADYYREGSVVVDIIDNKTGKLVYRDFATGDLTGDVSDAQLRARINAAVKQALAKFFR